MQTHQDIWFNVSDQTEHIFFQIEKLPNPYLDFIPWPIRVTSIIFGDGSQQNTAGGGQTLIAGTGISLVSGPAGLTINNTQPPGEDQSPWLTNINAAGNAILNLSSINGIPIANFLPAGAAGQVQFNAGTTPPEFGASANLVWDNVNGRLGIGTATPQVTLQVLSGTPTTNLVLGDAALSSSPQLFTGYGRAWLSAGSYGNYGQLMIDGSQVSLCRNDQSNGKVGVGVLTANYKLDVWLEININAASTGIGPSAPFGLSFSNDQIPASDQRIALIAAETGTIDSGVLIFYTANAGVLTEHMRIDSQGNLGIRTQTPAYALDVNGTCRIDNALNLSGLPISPAGLNPGDVWNNGGVLNIV